MDIQENDIEQEVFSKEANYFESEEIISNVNEILKGDESKIIESLQNIFGEIRLNYINQGLIVSFSNYLKRIDKENLSKFINYLLALNLSSKLLINVISEGILSFLHSRFYDLPLLKISTKFILEKINLIKFRKAERFAKIFYKALKDEKVKEAAGKLLEEITSENVQNFNFIYLIGLLLKHQCLQGLLKTNLENTFVNYYCNYILSDDDRDKNLAKQRSLNSFLSYISKDLVTERVFPDVESLLLRSSNNFKFLENLFLYSEIEFDFSLSKELLVKYNSYFFNDKSFESAKKSFSKLANILDKKTLLDKLLSFNFLSDKADLNLNVCYFLTNLIYSTDLKIKKSEKTFYTSSLDWDDVCILVTFILKKLEMQNENNKNLFETILENTVKGLLLFREDLNNDFCIKKSKSVSFEKAKLSKNLQEELIKQLKKLLSASNYSFYYQHIYMILGQFITKTSIELDKQLLDTIFNQLNLLTQISNSNYKNGLALISLGFSICSFLENSANYLNTYKKNITQAVNCFINPDAFVLLAIGLSSNNSFDLINILTTVNSFTSHLTRNKNFSELYANELTDIIKIVSVIIFSPSKKLYEKVLFRRILSEIKEKEFFRSLINNSFIYIMNNFSLDTNNQNSKYYYQKNYEKNSFSKLSCMLEYYALFLTQFEDQDYLKFIVLVNLNNIDNDNKKNSIKSGQESIYKNKLINKFISYSKETDNMGTLIENNLCNFISENYKTLASFIFSDIGLFNPLNVTIKHSCLNLIKFVLEKKMNQTLTSLVTYCFDFLDSEKLKFIDQISKFYKKEIDYMSFYDLENLVEYLKSTEKKYTTSLALNMIPEKKVTVQNTANIASQKTAKGKAQPTAQNKPQAPQKKQDKQEKQPEKVDKEVKMLEYKGFIENFIYKISKTFENNLLRIFEITSILNKSIQNNENKIKGNLIDSNTYANHKANLSYSIKKIWKIFNVEFIAEAVKPAFMKLFASNLYTKNFNQEFALLMYSEVNPQNLNSILDSYPNILETFNEKLNHLLNPEQNTSVIEKHKLKLFEYFDYIIIRILFYSILAPEIPNEQKSNSVDNLIKIIETLNKEILNFEDISILAVSLLKTSYNSDNLSILLEIFMKRCSKDNFLTLCNDILDYEYVAKLSFLEQILHMNFSYLRNYKNLVYKIWILLFDENENISNCARNIWKKFHLYIDDDYADSEEFSLAFTNHTLVDSMNAANRAYAFIRPNQINKLIKQYEKFFEKDLEESQSREKEKENDYEPTKIKRKILFDFIDETIDLFSEDLKKDLLDFLTRISDKEYNNDVFVPMNTSIFNIIKSISNLKILQNIIESSQDNIKAMLTKAGKDLNLKYLKIVLMILNSILMKDNILKTVNIKSSTVFNFYFFN